MGERTPLAERVRSTRLLQKMGLTAVSVTFGASMGALYFDNDDVRTSIAATQADISPNLNNPYVTFEGGLLGEARLPSEFPVGLDINLGTSTVPSGGMVSDNGMRLLDAYAAAAAQPDGEVAKVESLLREQLVKAGLVGLAAGLAPVLAYMLLGPARRKELYEHGHATLAVGTAALVVAGFGAVSTAESGAAIPDAQWVPITAAFPNISMPAELQALEIRDSAVLGIAENVVASAVNTYDESKTFYDDLKGKAEQLSTQLHQPEEGQVVAFVVSDRHDNIGMDPVLEASARAAGATIVINTGDDTSSGQKWEEFSLRSFANTFKDYQLLVAIGNHDNTGVVLKYYKNETDAVMSDNGATLHEVEGITVLLANDPRRSDYTSERAEGEVTFEEARDEITDLACTSDQRVGLVVTHDANMAKDALSEGCVDAVVAGHLHRYVPPTRVDGENGAYGYTMTNGSSAGASFAFSAGAPLKGNASGFAMTFEKGQLVGTQQITYTRDGDISVGAYTPLIPFDAAALPKPEPDTPNAVKRNLRPGAAASAH